MNLMSQGKPNLFINVAELGTSPGPSTPNESFQTPVSPTYSGSKKKKKGVHRIKAKFPSFARSYGLKKSKACSASDSGSSGDEQVPSNVPSMYLSPTSTNLPGRPLNTNNVSMPDLLKEPGDGTQKFLRNLRKPQHRSVTNDNLDGYFSEGNAYVSLMEKARSSSRSFPSAPIPLTASNVFRRRGKHKTKNSLNSTPVNLHSVNNPLFFSGFPVSPSNSELASFNSQSETPKADRLSVQLNLESVSKYKETLKTYLFQMLSGQSDPLNFFLFRMSERGLFFYVINNQSDQTWCIEHFKTFAGGGQSQRGEIIRDEGKQSKNNNEKVRNRKTNNESRVGSGSGSLEIHKDNLNSSKGETTESITSFIEKFENQAFKILAKIDDVSVTDVNKESEPETLQISFNRKQQKLILRAPTVADKQNFINRLQFFIETTKKPLRGNIGSLRYRGIEKLPPQLEPLTYSTSENDEYVYQLIEEVGNECAQHEKKITELRQTIGERSQQLDVHINKIRELDRRVKDLNESILSTRVRSIREMDVTIESANDTTKGLAEELNQIKGRISKKSETLKQHQQLLIMLQNQVEMEKRSAKMLAQYKLAVTVLTTTAVIFVAWFLFL